MDVCTNNTEITFNYTTCSTPIAFSGALLERSTPELYIFLLTEMVIINESGTIANLTINILKALFSLFFILIVSPIGDILQQEKIN